MTTKNNVRYCGCLVALADLLGTLPGTLIGSAVAEVAVRAEAVRPAAGGGRVRKQQSPEKTAELLAAIPDDHPQRDELRMLVREGPPEGFSAEEWLRLAMKFNFRTPGSPRLREAAGE